MVPFAYNYGYKKKFEVGEVADNRKSRDITKDCSFVPPVMQKKHPTPGSCHDSLSLELLKKRQ